jgi:hypothetical protein
MDEFRRGQNARRIDLDNASSANATNWPKDRGGSDAGAGGGGALLFILLALGPIVVAISIPSLVSAWILRRSVPMREGAPGLTRLRLFAAAFFTTLATGIPGAPLVLGLWDHLTAPQRDYVVKDDLTIWISVAPSLALMLLGGGLALKLSLRSAFPGFAGYFRACLTSLPVGVCVMLFVGFAVAVLTGIS